MQKHLLLALCMASAAASTTLSAADFTPPCEIPCSTQEEFDTWTVIDVSMDKTTTWTFDSSKSAADYTYSKSYAADDWLISPAVAMKAGVSYDIMAYMAGSGYSVDRESFEICVGATNTIEGMTSKLFTWSETTIPKLFDWRGGLANKAVAFTPDVDGDYYIGIHCNSVSYRDHVYVQKVKVDAVIPYPAAAKITSITVAPEGRLEACINWTMPEKDNLGGSLAAVAGAYIYRGTTASFAIADASLVGTYTGGSPGGECSWTDNTVTTPGKYYYAVVPFNDNGVSPTAVTRMQSDWIGMDTGVGSVPSVTAVLQEGSDINVIVTWETPQGANGAPIDVDKIAYRISRVGLVNAESQTIAEGVNATSYVDEVSALDKYTYTVSASYNGGSYSWSGTKSNEITAGGALTPPFREEFTGSSETEKNKIFALWTLFHGEECTRDWGISSNALDFWGGSSADAWAVMPPMSLEAAKPYELAFTARVSNSNSPKHLYVYIGTKPTPESLEEKQLFYEIISSGIASPKNISISVPEAGRYYIAFRCYGPTDYNDIYIDDLTLEETVFIPAAVTDLTAAVAEKGAMEATISWINPAKTNAGTDLSEITKIEVLRGNDVIATLTEGLTPSESGAYVDNTIESAGKYIYKVIPYLGANAGPSASVESGWVGPDTPAAPSSVTATLTDEGRVVAFEANVLGLNGGYVDANALTFTITRNGSEIATGLTTSPFTDSDDLEFGNYVYGVKIVNGSEESDITEAAPLKFGSPLELPYKVDSFNEDNASLWTLTGDNPDKTWVLKDGALTGNFIADNSWAFTPPLNLVHSELKVKVNGSCYNYRNPETVELYISKSTDHNNTDHHQLVHTATFDSSWGQDAEQSFIVTHPGTYHIGIRLPENNWTAKINSASLEATTILTGVEDVTAEGDGMLMYSRTFDFIQAPEGVVVSVYNAAGVLVLRAQAVDGHVDTSALASGLYVAAATASGENLTLKFAK